MSLETSSPTSLSGPANSKGTASLSRLASSVWTEVILLQTKRIRTLLSRHARILVAGDVFTLPGSYVERPYHAHNPAAETDAVENPAQTQTITAKSQQLKSQTVENPV